MGVKETVLKLTNIMDDIEYGWVDANYNKHYGDFESFGDKYMIQDSQELLQNKVGVCWDQLELERDFLEKNNIKFSTYFIVLSNIIGTIIIGGNIKEYMYMIL